MMKKIYFLAFLFLLSGCGQKEGNRPEKSDAADLNETLIKANKQVVLSEDQQIDDLLERYGWNMTETGTGLRYLIYKRGNGPSAQKGQQATIRYNLRLISGDIVYSSDDLGPKQFTIGSGGVESGLEEAILLMHLGDQAKVVIPSYLAFGLIGDQDRIPPKSTLIYDIELIKLTNN
ncbi:MAG TPA: FKBP-type peptidyl-prolyl cis-trans isomerase [Bacteroidales bacterium]|nr:FKBP-type peptidyl-prolyl cis-trans isomerase [Bacteroidales bacterium]HPT01645.1 FKBP-type peptidyl-prolyl cis-trans isomerase [Bacteroidales bacterium]